MNRAEHDRLAQAARCLSPPVQKVLQPHISKLENNVQEIRLQTGRPVTLVLTGGRRYLTPNGGLTDLPEGDVLCARREDLEATLQRACEYSVYARQKELQQGFVTLHGGHRLGICGTAVTDAGGIVNVRDISSLHLRIARAHRGCAEAVFRAVRQDSGGVLLCGPPCSGKTTLLRDLARLLSTVGCQSVSLIDERGELAAVARGEPQNDVGFCDVFDGYPKAQAIEQALRCMAPQVIICDEIGSSGDVRAIQQCLFGGVRVIATAHAADAQELRARPALRELLDTGAFTTFIFLRGRQHVGEIASISKGGICRAA